MNTTHSTLQAASSASDSINNFFNSGGLGAFIGNLLVIIGVLVMVAAIVRVVQSVIKGDVGKAIKSVLFSGVLVVFLFYPASIGSLIDVTAKVVNMVISTVSNTSTSSGGGSTPVTVPSTVTSSIG
jgi:hypothetical protein